MTRKILLFAAGVVLGTLIGLFFSYFQISAPEMVVREPAVPGESRIEYVRRNWFDVVIILLPLLRPLRAFRATQGLARSTRVFRLRGVGMKCARYVFTILIGLKATDRLLQRIGLKSSDERKDAEKMTRHELTRAVKRLRRRNDAWEQWYEAHERYVERHGGACYLAPPPAQDEPADDTPHLSDEAVEGSPPAS